MPYYFNPAWISDLKQLVLEVASEMLELTQQTNQSERCPYTERFLLRTVTANSVVIMNSDRIETDGNSGIM